MYGSLSLSLKLTYLNYIELLITFVAYGLILGWLEPKEPGSLSPAVPLKFGYY